jgi:hypothetical protein
MHALEVEVEGTSARRTSQSMNMKYSGRADGYVDLAREISALRPSF